MVHSLNNFLLQKAQSLQENLWTSVYGSRVSPYTWWKDLLWKEGWQREQAFSVDTYLKWEGKLKSEKYVVVDSTQLTCGIVQESFWQHSQKESKFDFYIYTWKMYNHIKDEEVQMIAIITDEEHGAVTLWGSTWSFLMELLCWTPASLHCWVNTPVTEPLGKHTCELWVAEVLHSLLSSSGLGKNPSVPLFRQ